MALLSVDDRVRCLLRDAGCGLRLDRLHDALVQLQHHAPMLRDLGVTSTVNNCISALNQSMPSSCCTALCAVEHAVTGAASIVSSSDVVSTARLEQFDSFLSSLALRRVPDYPYTPGDCLFDTVSYLLRPYNISFTGLNLNCDA